MEHWLLPYQLWYKLGAFIVTFCLLALYEQRHHWRPWMNTRRLRWSRYFSLAVMNFVIVRLSFPIITITLAELVTSRKIGFLNQVTFPLYAKVILGFMAMDFAMFWQHRTMHRYGILWRFHRVHHIENQLDISTGLRFHPVEAMWIFAIKMLAIGLFGVPALGVLLYEIWLNFALLFTHLNVELKENTEKWLRKVIVTPGMHRIHHSDYPPEHNSNYGFAFIWWDKMLNCYKSFAKAGERKLLIGLEEYRDPKYQTLENMLLLPFNFKNLKSRPKKHLRTRFKESEELPK